MKRYRIKNKFRFTVCATFVLVMLAFLISLAFGYGNVSGAEIQDYIQVEIQYGDTLWDLAKRYGPAGADIRLVVEEICRINGISASTFYAGDYITIPKSI